MKILLIALHYHDYTSNIAEELRLLGHSVSVHDIMPRDLLMKGLRVLSPALWQRRLDRHHARILERERGADYEMVLFIQAHQVSATNMAGFKAAFPDARFVLYNWDSIANHDYRPNLPSFDQVFTFDPDDARAYGLEYLPLFCSREFQGLARLNQDRRAVYFVGNIVNPARYEAISAFRAYCESHAVPLQAFMACTPPARLLLRRKGLKPVGLSYGSIGRPAFLNMIETSVAVFDFANHHQSGYTMRVFENLCAGKKIITNNPRIRHEPFYSADRIHVFSGLEFDGVREFIARPLADPEAQFPDYRIQAFVRHLVDGAGHALPPPHR